MSEKRKRNDLTIYDKLSILQSYDNLPKMGQREAAIKLQISQPGKEEQVESALLLWFINVKKNDARINGPILCQKAEELAKKMGIENFIASEGWFHRWKKRENIVYKRTYGEQKDADFSAAENWLKTEWPKIISEYTPDNVYNADETGLFYRALPEHSYLFKNENVKGYALHLITMAWDQVTDKTIRNCFKHGGFAESVEEEEEEYEEVDLDFENWLKIDENIPTTSNFTEEDIVHALSVVCFGLDPTDEFNTIVQVITPSRYVNMPADFLRRIFSLMGNILSFILDLPQKYKRNLFLETETISLSSMVYQGENMLVIESKTQDGCRVLLNRTDLIRLQYLEWSIHETVARKSAIIRPTVLKQFEIIGDYIDREFTKADSPPKTSEEMIIFINNLSDNKIIVFTPKEDMNFISQLKMFASSQLAEQWAQRWNGEMSPELFTESEMRLISPPQYSSMTPMHDEDNEARGADEDREELLTPATWAPTKSLVILAFNFL
ncbi:hypothetical protein QTP88_001250 [Uroleucon formosanum]